MKLLTRSSSFLRERNGYNGRSGRHHRVSGRGSATGRSQNSLAKSSSGSSFGRRQNPSHQDYHQDDHVDQNFTNHYEAEMQALQPKENLIKRDEPTMSYIEPPKGNTVQYYRLVKVLLRSSNNT